LFFVVVFLFPCSWCGCGQARTENTALRERLASAEARATDATAAARAARQELESVHALLQDHAVRGPNPYRRVTWCSPVAAAWARGC
jgi:hypothetical protein